MKKKAIIFVAMVFVLVAMPIAVKAQVGEVPGHLLKKGLYNIMKLRQKCYENCGSELAQKEQVCTEKYTPTSVEWRDCMYKPLRDYYYCTESCPPKKKEITLPGQE